MVKKHWILGHLNDVIDSLVAGVSVNSGENDASGNFFILKTSAISKGKLNLSEKKPVLPREVARLKCSLRQETILISRMNTPELVGECAYVPCDDPRIYLPDRIWQTNFKKDVDVSAKWLNYLLSSKKYRSLIQNCATGTSNSMKNISKEQLLGLEILYPSFREQTSIAEALSDVDSLISSLQELIEKKKAIKQGAMQELLTGKKRLPGFSGEWSYKSLGILGDLSREAINPQSLSETSFYEYSMPAYDNGRQPEKTSGKSMHSSRLKIYGDIILFNKLNVRQRRVWHVKECLENAVCSSEFLPYHSLGVHSEFLYQVLLCDKTTVDFENMSTGTSNSQKRITPSDFLEYEIALPEKDEQEAIAQVLSDMDSEIEQLEKKLAKYQQIKQGMMQELLTGRIRLKEGENNA